RLAPVGGQRGRQRRRDQTGSRGQFQIPEPVGGAAHELGTGESGMHGGDVGRDPLDHLRPERVLERLRHEPHPRRGYDAARDGGLHAGSRPRKATYRSTMPASGAVGTTGRNWPSPKPRYSGAIVRGAASSAASTRSSSNGYA